MKKVRQIRLGFLLPIALILALLMSACAAPAPARLPEAFTYSPGASFQINIKEDPRAVIRCTVIFQVIDEDAITDLAPFNPMIRNAVLIVLGDLTLDEITENRDLEDIAQRIVDRVNDSIQSHYSLVLGAYFTDFVVG